MGGELGEVGDVNPLHRLVKHVWNQDLVKLVEAGDPVRETTGVVVGSEYDSRSNDAKRIGKRVEQDFFAADFERSVGCGCHLASLLTFGNFGFLGQRKFCVFDVVDADR